MQRNPRQHDDAHLRAIRELPCVVCGDISTEAAHIRYSELRMGKRSTGRGEKPHDLWTIPLCGNCHRKQHAYGREREWWQHIGKDPLPIALALYVAPDHETRMQIVEANR